LGKRVLYFCERSQYNNYPTELPYTSLVIAPIVVFVVPTKSPIFPPKKSISPPNSRQFLRKSPTYPQKSPVYPQKIPTCHLSDGALEPITDNCAYLCVCGTRKRVVYFRKRAVYFRKRSLYNNCLTGSWYRSLITAPIVVFLVSSKELYIFAKEPYMSAKDPYITTVRRIPRS